jgi:hypothetical protein
MSTHDHPTRSARMRGYLSITPATTPLGILAWVWRQVPLDDRLTFLAETLTPVERRLLQEGLDASDADAELLDDEADETPDTATFRYDLGQEVRWAESPRTPYVIVQRRWTQRDVFAPLVEYLCTPRRAVRRIPAWVGEPDLEPWDDARSAREAGHDV